MLKKALKEIYWRLPASAILMFHHVTDRPSVQKSGCVLAESDFYRVIDRYEAYASLKDVVARPSARRLAVTFDDGLEDLYAIAYPYLKRKKIPFTAFIVTEFLDTEGYISTEQLKTMAEDELVTIGSHGLTHKVFPELTLEEKENELRKSRQILEDLIGRPVDVFAYSHGQYDQETLDLTAKYYELAASVRGFSLNFFNVKKRTILPRLDVEDCTLERVVPKIDKIARR